MDRERVIEAFDGIVSTDLRTAIAEAILSAHFVESVISGGGDSYTKTAGGSQKSKPESKIPVGVEHARHFRGLIVGFDSVSAVARRLEVRIDEIRDIHDGIDSARLVEREKHRSALRVVRHLTQKAKLVGVMPEEDERG